VETPVWVGGSAAIMCVAVVDRLLVSLEGGWRIPVALAFVWATVAPSVGDLAPSWAVFAVVAPVLVYNFLGFELPSVPARSPAPCTRSRCWPSSWSSWPTGSPA
jgi:hypothetical protein